MGVVSCGTTMLDQGVFENIGAVTWDTTVKTSGFTAVSGNGYFCNTTSAAFTVTLPVHLRLVILLVLKITQTQRIQIILQ
jgi:hypothetical protein